MNLRYGKEIVNTKSNKSSLHEVMEAIGNNEVSRQRPSSSLGGIHTSLSNIYSPYRNSNDILIRSTNRFCSESNEKSL